MGYTHYWYRKQEIDQKIFKDIINDFNKLLPEFKELGIDLANGDGADEPIITDELISFNGRYKCGHKEYDLGITWPSNSAGGIALKEAQETVKGQWFAGALIEQRTCDGDCSHETFYFPRFIEDWYLHLIKDADNVRGVNGFHFDCTKTAYKPYDLAVICALIIAKHYLKDDLVISSDGEENHWFDGKMLCHLNLEYGLGFKLRAEEN